MRDSFLELSASAARPTRFTFWKINELSSEITRVTTPSTRCVVTRGHNMVTRNQRGVAQMESKMQLQKLSLIFACRFSDSDLDSVESVRCFQSWVLKLSREFFQACHSGVDPSKSSSMQGVFSFHFFSRIRFGSFKVSILRVDSSCRFLSLSRSHKDQQKLLMFKKLRQNIARHDLHWFADALEKKH